MAFPVIESTDTYDGTGTSTNAVPYPTGCVAGDLVVVLIRMVDGAGIPNTAFTDIFTELFSALVSSEKIWGYARTYTGSEDSTFSLPLTSARRIAVVTLRISGHDGVVGVLADGITSDPPEVTAPWGSADNLYIAVAGGHYNTYSVDTLPSGYTGGVSMTRPGGANTSTSGSAFITTAYKAATSGADDPSAFSISSGVNYKAATIVVGPSAGASRRRSPLLLPAW